MRGPAEYALSRAGTIAQICLVLVGIECALWTHGGTQRYCFAAAFASIVLCVLISRPRTGELGIGFHGMIGASIAIPIAVVAASAGLLLAWQLGTLRILYGAQPPAWHSIFYAIWAFEQQFILNSFFYKRFENLFGDSTQAVLVTALLFSLVHLPNPVLVPATFIGGLFFVGVFRKWRNIYPIAIAHAILGLTLAMTIPDHWIRHMRVGVSFLRFHMRG